MKYREQEDRDLAQATAAFTEMTVALGRYFASQVEQANEATAPKPGRRRPEPDGPAAVPPPLAYGIVDAAKSLGVSKGTLWRWIKEGKINTVKLGARTLIRAEELRALLE